MSKVKSSQKKVTLSQMADHEVNNKRQALKDLKKLKLALKDKLLKSKNNERRNKTISKV